MLHKLTKTIAIASFLAASQASFLQTSAMAGNQAIPKINHHGFQICKELAYNGVPHWSAKVHGRLNEYSGHSDQFRVKTCFTSPGACAHFLNRIHHNINNIEQVYSARCKAEI